MPSCTGGGVVSKVLKSQGTCGTSEGLPHVEFVMLPLVFRPSAWSGPSIVAQTFSPVMGFQSLKWMMPNVFHVVVES